MIFFKDFSRHEVAGAQTVVGQMFLHYVRCAEQTYRKKQWIFYADQRRSLSGGYTRFVLLTTAAASLLSDHWLSVVALDLLFYKYIRRHGLHDVTVLELLVWWLVMAELISQPFKNWFFKCCVILLKCYGNLLNSAVQFGLWTYFARCSGCKFPIN